MPIETKTNKITKVYSIALQASVPIKTIANNFVKN